MKKGQSTKLRKRIVELEENLRLAIEALSTIHQCLGWCPSACDIRVRSYCEGAISTIQKGEV